MTRPAARRALVSGVLLFAAVQGGLNLAVRTDRLPLGDPLYAEKLAALRGHPEFFAGSPDAVRVLAVGSSRMQLGLDAGTFAADVSAGTGRPVSAYNFGVAGAGPLTHALYLRRLFAAGAAPDAVLLELHPAFVAELPNGEPFEARWLHSHRLRPGEPEALRSLGHAVPDPPHLGWKGWLTASYAYRFPALNATAPRWLPCPFGITLGSHTDPWGWVGGLDVDDADRRKLTAAAAAQYAEVFPGYRVGGPAVAGLWDALAVCRDHGVQVAVFVTPEGETFRGWYGDAGNAAFARFVAELRRAGVTVFDARGWLADGDFADGHHPTPAGAERFTRRLAAEAGPWVKEAK